MADKQTRRATTHDLGATRPDRRRNVVLVGPSSSGKTTLVETLLASSGAIPRAGSVADGTTVSDFEDSERSHQRSMSLAVTPLVHGGTKVNLVDTPGYADFVGELRAGLRAADCALFVVAANEGVDEATRDLARVRPGADAAGGRGDQAGRPPRRLTTRVLGQAQAAYGDKVLPLYLPDPRRRGGDRARGAARPVTSRANSAGPADRGDHRGVRGRVADGPLPRRRGDQGGRAGRRPGEGGGPRRRSSR